MKMINFKNWWKAIKEETEDLAKYQEYWKTSTFPQMRREIAREKERGNVPEFIIEPGTGETYRTNKPTLYMYGTYPEYSVMAGRSRRVFIDPFPSESFLREFLKMAEKEGFEITISNFSQFTKDEMLDLPDEEGKSDPNYIPPTSHKIHKHLKDIENQ